jgi:hypothetical protein
MRANSEALYLLAAGVLAQFSTTARDWRRDYCVLRQRKEASH